MRFHAVKGGVTVDRGGTLTIRVRHHHYDTIHLRPGSKDPEDVKADIEQRTREGRYFEVRDRSGDWFFKYAHRVNGKNDKPDPDRAFLRHHEQKTGVL